MLFYMYQVFSSLQGHLHFLAHFFFTFMEYFFLDQPIPPDIPKKLDAQRQYVVIGSLALLFLFWSFFVNFWCKQGSGPEGGDVLVILGDYPWGLAGFMKPSLEQSLLKPGDFSLKLQIHAHEHWLEAPKAWQRSLKPGWSLEPET